MLNLILGYLGLGLMLGVKTRRDVSDVLAGCQERGLLPLRAKDKLRLLPPLNIPDELLARGIEILKEVCAQ